MNGKDVAKLIAAAIAIYGVYSAWQAYEKKENLENAIGLAVAGASAFTALHRLG